MSVPDRAKARDFHIDLLAAGCQVHAPADLSTLTVNPDGSKSGSSATCCRDWFGNVFEIMEIHDTDAVKRV